MAKPEQQTELSERSSQSNELVELKKRLGPQLSLFCYEYIVDYDHRRAATAVGRRPEHGIKMLRNADVAKFINVLADELQQDSLITRDMVQFELLNDFIPMAKGLKNIAGVDRDGAPWNQKVTNLAAYGRGIDLMAKHSGFTQAEVAKGGVTVIINEHALGITIEGETEERKDVVEGKFVETQSRDPIGGEG